MWSRCPSWTPSRRPRPGSSGGRERCDEIGRPWSEIEKTALKRLAIDTRRDVAQQALDQLAPLAELGIDHAIVQLDAPWEPGAVERLAEVVEAITPIVPAGR